MLNSQFNLPFVLTIIALEVVTIIFVGRQCVAVWLVDEKFWLDFWQKCFYSLLWLYYWAKGVV